MNCMKNVIRTDCIDRIINYNRKIEQLEKQIADVRKNATLGIRAFSGLIDQLEQLKKQKQELLQQL